MRILFVAKVVPTLVMALLLASAANSRAAEIYKWVDGNGVVNYSSEPPPAGRKAKTVEQQPISSYSPEAAGLAGKERDLREMQYRIDRLQREMNDLRLARAYDAAMETRAAAYDPCVQDRPINCSSGFPGQTYPYYYPPVLVVGRVRQPVVPTFFLPSRPRVHAGTRGHWGRS